MRSQTRISGPNTLGQVFGELHPGREGNLLDRVEHHHPKALVGRRPAQIGIHLQDGAQLIGGAPLKPLDVVFGECPLRGHLDFLNRFGFGHGLAPLGHAMPASSGLSPWFSSRRPAPQ